MKLLSCVRLLATPQTAAYQAPPSMGFSRQGYWSGLPLPSLSPPLPLIKWASIHTCTYTHARAHTHTHTLEFGLLTLPREVDFGKYTPLLTSIPPLSKLKNLSNSQNKDTQLCWPWTLTTGIKEKRALARTRQWWFEKKAVDLELELGSRLCCLLAGGVWTHSSPSWASSV